MARIVFTRLGRSELVDSITSHLQRTYTFVPSSNFEQNEHPKLVLVDALDVSVSYLQSFLSTHETNNVYYLVISSDVVYSDLGADLEPRPQSKMGEDWPSIVPSPLDPSIHKMLKALQVESLLLQNTTCSVLRPFGIYDSSFKEGLIADIVAQVKTGEVELDGDGSVTRTFLPLEDLLFVVSRVAKRLLADKPGIYNVGSPEAISYKHLIETIWSFVYGPGSNPTVKYKRSNTYIDLWKIPDITRISAVLQWSPKTSLRKGLWNLLQENRQ